MTQLLQADWSRRETALVRMFLSKLPSMLNERTNTIFFGCQLAASPPPLCLIQCKYQTQRRGEKGFHRIHMTNKLFSKCKNTPLLKSFFKVTFFEGFGFSKKKTDTKSIGVLDSEVGTHWLRLFIVVWEDFCVPSSSAPIYEPPLLWLYPFELPQQSIAIKRVSQWNCFVVEVPEPIWESW